MLVLPVVCLRGCNNRGSLVLVCQEMSGVGCRSAARSVLGLPLLVEVLSASFFSHLITETWVTVKFLAGTGPIQPHVLSRSSRTDLHGLACCHPVSDRLHCMQLHSTSP